MQVAEWLRALGLDQYTAQFGAHDITSDLLPTLTADDLKDLGVSSVGHRRRLLDAIALLGGERSAAAAEEATRSPKGQPMAGERRQVTVLFADLTNYTELSARLDAEEIESILTAFFDVADAAIVAQGGLVDKHIGDCVMAVFGAPLAHDNDAERAVLAAQIIRDSVPALRERLGREIGVHVGVASGEVLASHVGSARHSAYTVTGDSVNLASRLTDKARSGEVLLSSAVYRALQDRLDCEVVGQIDIKGLTAPVTAWRLLRLRPVSTRSRAFVGRLRELRQFTAAIDACLETRRGSIVCVRGEAGLGKTRLIEEFQNDARSRGFGCHSGLVLDFGSGSGRDAVRSMLRSVLLDHREADLDPEAMSRFIERGVVGPDRAIFLYDLLNVPPPLELRGLYNAMDTATRNRGLLATITEVAASAAKTKPLMIVIEDLHWADAATLSQISAVADAVTNCPVLLVVTSRNVDDTLAHGWQAFAPMLTIDLAPLHQDEALELAGTLLDRLGPVATGCVARAAGNPLFLEQLLRNAEELAEGDVPDSVQSLVQAQLDRLEPRHKEALQVASVFGQRFHLQGLRALIDDRDYLPSALVERALVRPHEDQFLFGHALIRDAVYSTLLRSRRRELHRRAAAWFADSDLGLHAEHLDRADDPSAAQAYLAATKAESARYRYEQAFALLGRGAALAQDKRDRFALICLRGELLHDTGQIVAARDAFEQAALLASDDAERCRSWLGVAAVKRVTDDLAGALQDVERVEDVASRSSLVAECARAHFLHGNLLFPRGDVEGCLREQRHSLQLARAAGSAELEAAAFGGLGDAEYVRGRMLTAREHFSNCVALSRRHGFGRTEVANLPMLAFMQYFAGDTRAALQQALLAIEMATKVGHRRALTVAHHAAFHTRLALGELDAARANVDAALELARLLKAPRFEAEALAFGAELSRLCGRRSEALAAISTALQISAETGMEYFGPVYYATLALIEEHEAPRRAALSNGEALLAGNVVAHNHLLYRKDAIEACLLLRDWSEAERHAAALEDFVRPEPLLWAGFIVSRARIFAALGRGCPAGEVESDLQRLKTEGDRLGIYLPGVAEVIAK